ncbi:MAG: murein DD-endopeptidase MepM/ murein hydrolase activator NlpD [Paracoccaceae bacterium]|jgi:murein DD-endopeptidase MepM/ murein hydrolase activator NlpD
MHISTLTSAVVGLIGLCAVPHASPMAQNSDLSAQGTRLTPTSPFPVEVTVSPTGTLEVAGAGALFYSPQATSRVKVQPGRADLVGITSRLSVETSDGRRSEIANVLGAAIWATDVERIVVLEDHCSNTAPRMLSVLNLRGERLFSRAVVGVTNPALSSDGTHFAFRDRNALMVLDLVTFELGRYQRFEHFAVGNGGMVAGTRFGARNVVEVTRPDGSGWQRRTAEPVRHLAVLDESIVAMGRTSLVEFEDARAPWRLRASASPDAELYDLRVQSGSAFVGERQRGSGTSRGRLLTVTPGAATMATWTTAVRVPTAPDVMPSGVGEIPWPLRPNAQHPIGNSYAEYQRYGGSPYMHPGIDVLGAPQQPVFAVEAGEVKAVLTTSGQYHWRVAIGNAPGSAASEGYLYAHLIQSTIAVDSGDIVAAGDYLGDLVAWPVANFTHVHFARIEDSGAQWSGSWLNTDNPHLDLPRRTDATAPVFEPAIGGDSFAFCRNESSTYLSPSSLAGRVDIIARVSDTIASTWRCSVQTLRYSIYPEGSPNAPVVDHRLAVAFDMATDTYAGGPVDPFLVDLLFKQDSTCQTEGNYGDREFYHVVTNSNGDETYELSDMAESWDTTAVPNGRYVIEVLAADAAGNSSLESMTVTVAN